MKRIMGVLIMQSLLLPATQEPLRPLTAAAMVPDVFLPEVLCYPERQARLSHFSDGLLIQNFRTTWSYSCLHVLPDLLALQQKFSGRLRRLLVNAESTCDDEQIIRTCFLLQLKRDAYGNLPVVQGDTLLHRLFLHKLLPHYVWIMEGRVVAITGMEALTPVHVQNVLEGLPLTVRMKPDEGCLPDPSPLMRNTGGMEERAWCRSLSYRHPQRQTVSTTFHMDSAAGTCHLKLLHCRLQDLYAYAWNIQLEVEESGQFPMEPAWCYELLLPSVKRRAIRSWMQQDLVRYFGYRAGIEKRRVPSLILREAGRSRRARPADTPPGERTTKRSWRHEHTGALAALLSHTLALPVVNQSRRVVELPEE